MKVKELIAALQLCDQELEVYSICDHGQAPEKVMPPSVIYAENLKHILWDDYAMNEGYAEDWGYTEKAILI